MRVIGGEPFLWEKHWRRLSENSAKLLIDMPKVSGEKLLADVRERIRADRIDEGRVRVTISDRSASAVWPDADDDAKGSAISMISGPLRSLPKKFRLTISPHLINSTSPLAGIKSCNYLENILALDEANARGFNEALRTNERGEVVAACMANLFWLKGGRLFTPSLATGCLKGTTREFVLENLECAEAEINIEELRRADAIFLTSAGLGIVEAACFDEQNFGPSGHAILTLLGS